MLSKRFLLVLPYVHLFVERLLKERIELRLAAIFGSCLGEDFTPNSDVDVMVVVSDKREIKKVKEIEEEVSKKLMDDGFRNYIHSVVDTEAQPEHIADGILIFGRPLIVAAGEKELDEDAIITYDTSSLPKTKRVSLAIRLFGQTLRRKNRVYVNEGIVSAIHGKKLKNAVLVNRADASKIEAALNEFGAPHATAYLYSEKNNKFVER